MTEYVRKIDSLGRIVIPVDYRKKAGIYDTGEARITEENGKIIIEKLHPDCKICGAEGKLDEQFGICPKCIEAIKGL